MEFHSACLKELATIDPDRQVVLVTTLFTSMLSPFPAQLTREVSFAHIHSVYLDMQEESRMVPEQVDPEQSYTQHLQVKRTWLLGAQLYSGETVTLFEQIDDQPAGKSSNASLQRGYWESLARHVSNQLGKPLSRMAPAPSSPRTIIEGIDQLLQRRLQQPPLGGRSVRLRSSGFGVEIWVDGRTYRTLDEIEDVDVLSALRAAIDEWQAKVP